MKLTLLERIVLGQILPKEGSYTDLIISEDISKKIQITQEEVKNYEIKEEDGRIKWNDKGVESEEDFEMSELEENLVKKVLEKMDKDEKLDNKTIGLYKKFCK